MYRLTNKHAHKQIKQKTKQNITKNHTKQYTNKTKPDKTNLGPAPLGVIDDVDGVVDILAHDQVHEGVGRVDVDRAPRVGRHGQVGAVDPLAGPVEGGDAVRARVVFVAWNQKTLIVCSA